MNRKKLFLWCLYDFANSIIWGNFLLYFTRWIVIDAGLSDLNFNLIFVACAIIMLFIAPRIAARVDRNGGLVRHLAVSTIGMTLFLAAAALFPIFSWPATIAAFMFLAGLTFYQMSFVFFTNANFGTGIPFSLSTVFCVYLFCIFLSESTDG